jgi:hypothetical protein
MNPNDKLINQVFSRISCLTCDHWRADAIKARIGAFLLAHIDGHPPPQPPTLNAVSHGCCKREDTHPGAVQTFRFFT